MNRPTGKTAEDRKKSNELDQLADTLKNLNPKKKSRGASTLSNGSHLSQKTNSKDLSHVENFERKDWSLILIIIILSFQAL